MSEVIREASSEQDYRAFAQLMGPEKLMPYFVFMELPLAVQPPQ